MSGFSFERLIQDAIKGIQLPPEFDPLGIQNEVLNENITIWKNFGNKGSVLVEEAFLLYALVRMTKPFYVVDAGTYIGISAVFMAEALRDNGIGRISTVEHNQGNLDAAKILFKELGYVEIDLWKVEFEDFLPLYPIDFLFLDTETAERVEQFHQLFPHLSKKSWVAFHDAGACKDIETIPYPYLHFHTVREFRVYCIEKEEE